jgi:hypothetical protein
MSAYWSRREFLAAGVALPFAAASGRWQHASSASRERALSVPVRRALGFPVPAEHDHGDSSIGAALRVGPQQPRRPRRAPPDGRQPPDWQLIGRSLARFSDLRRHFIFEYYPWYSTVPWGHWEENLRQPPIDLAASSVPWLGPYDSGDARVIEQHARWIAESGAGAIDLSWWGRDDITDKRVHLIMDVMRAHDIHVTFHLEPYADDRAGRYASDIMYLLHEYGTRRRWDVLLLLENANGRRGPVFKTFRTILSPTSTDCLGVTRAVPDYAPDSVWRRQTDRVRTDLRQDFDHLLLLGDSLDTVRTGACGLNGVAVYDAFVRPSQWPSIADGFTERDLLFSFSINAGFDKYPVRGPQDACFRPTPFEPPIGVVSWSDPSRRLVAEAASRDRVLQTARTTLALQANRTLANAREGFLLAYITTFNEWHEGTQFEPAKDYANLTAEERAIGYHNPTRGRWRLDLLQEILGDLQAGAADARQEAVAAVLR